MLKVILIAPDGCAHCVEVKKTLEKLKEDYPELELEEINAASQEGQRLIVKYSILSSPGILINDKFFAMGGATEKEFRKKFDELKREQD